MMAELFQRPTTVAAALMQRAGTQPNQLALHFLSSRTMECEALTYGQLDRRARHIAATLERFGAGERVVLLLPSGPDYVASFFGCLYAGIIAVPAYPPESTREQHLQRLLSIIGDAQPKAILTSAALAQALPDKFQQNKNFPDVLVVDQIDPLGAAGWQAQTLDPNSIAFLQYTSGSTSTPKGVQVSHANLEANEWLIRQGYGVGSDDVIVSWLPLYHDMGLIGGLLQGIYSGIPVVLMSPQYFLERPVRWLEAISEYGGTISGGPDFAFRLCHERIAEHKIAELNLSRWRIAFSGAEPIRQDSLALFAEKFARCGFRSSAFLASYGLAEATLFVTGGKLNEGIPALQVDAQALAANRVQPGSDTTLMSCGWAQPDHPWLIVDAQTGAIADDDCVGEIWASGPSIAQGYWRQPEATARTFVELAGRTWLRTGDLGFRHANELFVTGRIKDMLIIRGQNLYPQDIERTVETGVAAVRKGRVAAFAVEYQGRESLAIAAEVGRKTSEQLAPDELIAQIRRTVAETYQESPSVVVLLNPGALPKTSSGKLQRSACRAQLDASTLDLLAIYREGQSVALQQQTADKQSVAEHIAALWNDVLKINAAASNTSVATESFFALGGNSILAIQMIAELRDRLQIPLEIQTLFEANNLSAFTATVEALIAQRAGIERIPQIVRDRDLPQSPAQNRLWFLWQLTPTSAAYNIPGGLRLRGELDETALQAAFETLIARHESLRTTFYEQDGQGFQRINPPGAWHLSRNDLRDVSMQKREQHAAAICAEEARAPFDLERGPLLRFRLIALDEQDHLLLLTLHHIVADGWSLGILLNEFAQLYSAHVHGQAMTLPPLPIQYADYAAWSRDNENTAMHVQQLAYWRAELAELNEPLALPFDRLSSGNSGLAERFSVRLDKSLCARLRSEASANNATSFVLLLAALQVLLHRCCGQSDIRVGVPNANRQRLETQRLIGFFINTQVLRVAVEQRQDVSALLASVRDTVLRAQANPDVDFERVAAELSAGNDAPLFDVMFNHQQRDLSALRRLPGLLAEELPWHSREAKFPLQLHSEEDSHGNIRLSFDYAVDAFEPVTIENLAKRYVYILEQICAQPSCAVGDLNLLDDKEQQQLQGWGENSVDYPAQLLPELLIRQAQISAQSIALIAAEGSLTYAELDQRANALAHRLRELGVQPDVCVGIAAERSLDLIIALLAIVKAGGAYVPLDPDYPRARLNQMIRDSGITVLLGQASLLAVLEIPGDLQTIDFEQIDLQQCRDVSPPLNLHPDNLAYVIFTSGSTGVPKGVGITHGALAQRLHWMRDEYRIGADDVLLQKAPLSFDVSVWECFLPLISGARLALAGVGEQRDPKRLVELVQAYGVTALHFVPPMLQLFIDEAEVGSCHSLRWLFSGGEVLSAELCRRIRQRLPNAVLHNRYGPTETAINVTYWPCTEAMNLDVTDTTTRIPIGKPLANVICELRDANLALSPIGAQAELLLGGSGLARGYIGNPAQTAQRFIPAENGARLYRSGDRARWRRDGVLEYLGRDDEQIKLRGFRIELEEIRNRLLQQAGVADAAVMLRESSAGPQLVAYVCHAGDEQSAAELSDCIKSALQQTLPEYMVPAHIVCLEQLPLTPSGKLDRRALPEPAWQRREYIAPRDSDEQRLAAIWCEVIGCERVGRSDDFFELGGHSLLATRIVSRTRQAFDIELPLRSLFEHSLFSDFSACVARSRAEGSRNSYSDIALVDRTQRTSLSYSQQRMWFLWQLDPHSPAYNVGGAAIMRGSVAIDCFERALQALILRHETLRTTFPSEHGKPYQRVNPTSDVQLQQLDFSSLGAADVQQKLQTIADEQAHQPFDLERGPLLRICLIKIAEREHHLLVALHHIVTEGWAMDIFARELALLYEAFLQGRESPLEPLRVQYLDYSVWQRQWLESGEMQRQLAYWQQQLGDEQPLLELPSDRPRPAEQSYRGDLHRFDIDAELSAQVRTFNTERGLTLFMTMTAALAILLYRYSGQNDLRIGAPVANRIRPESEGLIGAFLNTQVLRIRPDGQMRGDELLSQVRQVVIEGQSHQDLPFDQLVDALQPQRSAAYNPLFQVMCNVQRWGFQQSRDIAGDLHVEYVVNDARATKFDLNLEVTDIDAQLRCCLTYSSDLFDGDTIERMARHWKNLLRALLKNPNGRLSELTLLDASEYGELVPNQENKVINAPGFTVQALFEQRVNLSPQAPALTFKNESLSYAELNACANRLAHRLREFGIGPEQRVGLALPRSFDMVIGLLAILKAGGAYVPLDPEYPRERLHYMIEDSGINLLLTHTALADQFDALPNGISVWNLDSDSKNLDSYPVENPAPINLAAHLAYLIYTSGSTGKPKGVAVTHGPLAMHCQATGALFGMQPDDCELHFYSINFDAASERLLVPLLFGARVVLREQGQWDAEPICDIIREQRVTVLGFTPSYGRQLAQWSNARGLQLPVRLCITGGEALTPAIASDIRAAFAPAVFFNAYGPTETVVMPLACRVPEQLEPDAGTVPIGRAVGARDLLILDADLALVPAGVGGELFVGGEGIARGYYDRPSLSAERFVANPFDAAGGRLYRTGDWVRQRRDGEIEYLGRIDQQVKIRGFRIELGEIEARLQSHAAVRECVVLAVDGPSGKQLVTYLVPVQTELLQAEAREKNPLCEQLQVHLRVELPEHMVPTQWILLAQLPLTANGKLDRAALPAPDMQARADYQAPRGEIEVRLVEIWREILNARQVGIDDNFFELGGDSILSIQVVSQARQANIHFTPKDLFRHQTIRALASIAQASERQTIDQTPVTGPGLLTPIQQWFFELNAPQPQHWNQSLLLQPQRALDTQRLRQTLQLLIDHHDALRQRFTHDADSNAWTVEYRPLEINDELLWVHRDLDEDETRALFDSAQRSLSLDNGPLLRAVLIEGGESQRLLLTIHHLAVDGVSWRILLDDFQRIYRELEQSATPTLPSKTSSQRDWATRLHDYANSESLREELNAWQAQLAAAPAELPRDNANGDNLECHAERVTLRLNAMHTGQLRRRAAPAYRVSINDLLLVALTRTLCRWSGDTSALIEIEGHGREEDLFDGIDLSCTVGWFTSTYPVNLSAVDALDNSIKGIKEQLRSIPNKGLGYGVLRYLADASSHAAIRALPQARITFNYLGQLDQAPAESLLMRLDQSAGDQHAGDTPLPNWLSLDTEISDGELIMRWTFSAQMYRKETIQQLADNYRRELKMIIAHCLGSAAGSITPSDFPLVQLTQAQLDALPVPAREIEDIYPLTPMQEGLLLHTLLEPGTGIYFMQDRYRIDSEIHVPRFNRAWRAVIARHEALRASFSWSAGETMLQIIHKKCADGVQFLDWQNLPATEHEQRLQTLLREERERGFDLLTQPPFRLRLIRLAPDRHWFIMSNHHILIDAWCRSLLMGDFMEIYEAMSAKREPQLDTPPRYRDFISWLQTQGLETSKQWWQQRLAGFERPSFIPSNRPILHDNKGMRVGDRYARLTQAQGVQLRDMAQRHQLTVNTFAQAAWSLVLLRYGRERDVVFGVTVAGRPASCPDLHRTVGLFINTVPLRVPMPQPEQKQSVKQWLRNLLEHNLELREHEHVALVAIQECSELPQGQPLFDSLFVFENAPVEHSVLDRARGLKASSDSGRTHTNYPLTVVCYPGDELGLHLSYDQRFFDTETIDRLLEDFRYFLLALMDGLDGDFSALPLLREAERQFLIEDCNRTRRDYPFERGYAALFAERVAAHPERMVARCMNESWTYAELDRQANRLGHQLIAAGVHPDQPVALLAERGLPLLGMMVGVFKAGAGCVSLDPLHPLQRLRHILEVSRAECVVCSASSRALIDDVFDAYPCNARPKLLVWEEIQQGSGNETALTVDVTPQHLAYVIYTSGSTGQPKGVAVEQAGMLNNQLSKVPYLQLDEHDVIAQTAAQSFDISVWQFLTAPLCGARVEIVPDAIAHNPAALLQHVCDSGISILESVPSLIQGMLTEDTAALGKLRCLLPTGEAMPPELARQWLQRHPDVTLINAYGPAECSDDVALFPVTEAATHNAYLPIGTPTDNNRLYLLDADLQPVPTGAIGELYIAGTGVGRGYIGDTVRTAQYFLPCPFADGGERLYRTGDLARQREDGVFETIGRADFQVKVRGFRIELGEIESRLHAMPEVRDVAVAVQDGPTGKHLVGYVVPIDTALLTSAEDEPANAWLAQGEYRVQLQQHLRAALPDYMVPEHWLLLKKLPLTANGKLDRKALPAFQFDQLQRDYQAPRSELERTLAGIWADVLKVERVGISDDFFALGGHSLLATQIASRVQRTLQRSVPLRAMFECSTVAELATYIESLSDSALNTQKTQRIDDLMSRLETL